MKFTNPRGPTMYRNRRTWQRGLMASAHEILKLDPMVHDPNLLVV